MTTIKNLKLYLSFFFYTYSISVIKLLKYFIFHDLVSIGVFYLKNDVYNLYDTLNIPPEITCYNGLVVPGIECLCMLLKIFSYPCRYLDMMPRFGRPVPQMSMITCHTMNLVYNDWNHLLSPFNQPWLAPRHLQEFADVVYQSGASLQNCWGS